MAQCRTKLAWKSGFAMGISRLRWMCVVMSVLSVIYPSARGQGVPDFNPIYFTSEPSDIMAIEGSTVTLNCSVHTSLVPVIQWSQNGNLVPSGDDRRTVQPDGSLRITAISATDEGSYQCNAEMTEEDFLTSLNSKKGTVTVAKLELVDDPEDIEAYSGDTVYFQCKFASSPQAQVSWLKNDQVLELSEERVSARYTLMPSGGLEIREVRSSDEGSYRCQGSNAMISIPVRSSNAVLTIISGSNPSFQFIRRPEETEAPVGQTVVLEAATDSPAVFTWFKDSEEIFIAGSGTEDHFSLLGQGSLQIQHLGEIDTGLYRVLATSVADGTRLDHAVKVTALVPMKFNIKPQNSYAHVGSDITLHCNAYGIPGPITSWFKDGDQLVASEIYEMTPSSLTIHQVIQEDAGMYQCVADNVLENIQASAELIVLREGVVIPTRPPTTTLQPQTPAPPPITTKSPPKLPDLGPVPTKPLDLAAWDVQAQSFRLTWREPSQLNGDLQSYRIYLKWDGGQKIDTTFDLGQLSKVISDLIPDTRYEVTIKALNENGGGSRSDVLVVETLPHGEYLGPSTGVRAKPEEGSCTALLLTWMAPPGEVLSYKVYYADLSGGVAQELELYTEEEFYLITGLKPLTNYGLRVVAFNANGPGTSSDNLEASTSQCKPSGIPDNITIEPESSTSVVASWNPPPPSQRNGLINGYKLKYRTIDNGRRTHSLVIDGSKTSHTIEDLERNTAYEIRMAAYNTNGTGPYSDWVPVTTFEIDKNEKRVPPMPTELHAKPTHNKIVVSWQPPVDDSIMVRGYILGYGPNIPDAVLQRLPSSQTQFTITNLQPSVMYVLKLRAFNKIGEGSSVYKDVQTLSGKTSTPSMPQLVTAIVTSPYDVVLSWVDPDYSPVEKPRDRYYTIKYKTDYPTSNKFIFVNSNDSSKVIRNLTPFKLYQFQVMAVSGNRESPYSMLVENTTFEAAPSSPPRSLTVIDVQNSSTSLSLNWQPPKAPNGLISGYTIYYSTRDSPDVFDWVTDVLTGDVLTQTVQGLTSDTVYYFKIQAHTNKGEGPVSGVVSHRTPELAGPLPPVYPVTASPVPLGNAEAMGFPWWLWLVIILAVLFIIIIAVLLLLCFVCGCCGCCGDCCPCCAALCEDACACCAPFCGPLAACVVACCPCCCEDENDCAKCWLKFCCGASACVCCGQAYRERKKTKGSANLVGYHAVSQNGKAMGNAGPVPPDLWINHEGVEIKKLDGKNAGIAMSPINAKAEERERLDKGVDQQREQVQETLNQSSVQNQQELPSLAQLLLANSRPSPVHSGMTETQFNGETEEHVDASNRQSQYETPTLMTATSQRSSLESDLHVGAIGTGGVHYATVDEMHTARKKSNLQETTRQDTVGPRKADSTNGNTMAKGLSERTAAPSITLSPSQNRTHSMNRAEVQNRAAGHTSPRYATWGAKANQNEHQQSAVNYNTTNIHMEDTRNNYTANDSFTTLRDGGYQGAVGASGHAYNTLDRQSSYNNTQSGQNQIITFPDQNAGPQPFTITYEETTTTHSVEKSVPMADGTNFKTASSHQTFAKSYTTSDASQDQNLQAMLQGGLENGPLAIEIPSTTNSTLPAITAAPLFRSASFNPIPQDTHSTGTQSSSGISNTLGRSPPPPSYNFAESASAQTQSSGYGSGSANARGRTSSVGASSIDSTSYRRLGSETHLNTSDHRAHSRGTTSPIDIPPQSTSPYGSSFQTYDSYRAEEMDNGFGQSGSDLFGSSAGLTRPQTDRVTGFNVDSAYGSPSSYNGGFGSHNGASTLGKYTGGTSVPTNQSGNSHQFKSLRSYNSNDATSAFSFNNNNASSTAPSNMVEVEHAEVQTPNSRFNSRTNLLHSSSSSLLGNGLDSLSTPRPLRRSMSVDNEFGLENYGHTWSGSSQTGLVNQHSQREVTETNQMEASVSESQRGRSRLVGDKTYGGINSRSRSLDRFGEREDHHVSPVGGFDYHMSSQRQHQVDRPAYMYPTNTASSGYHSDTNTTSSHDDGSSTQGSTSRAGNPLSSFSVPGPPPNYQAAKVKIQAPAYSPLKRNAQPGVARVRAQPLPVVTPRAPDVTYRGVGDGTSPGTANRSFSTEDLNTEMLNLEGLMKDLNAITASELQS